MLNCFKLKLQLVCEGMQFEQSSVNYSQLQILMPLILHYLHYSLKNCPSFTFSCSVLAFPFIVHTPAMFECGIQESVDR